MLRRFALAVVSHADASDIDSARDAVRAAVGPAGLADVCGVVAAFDGITRVADATGTELDEILVAGIGAGLLGDLDTTHLQTFD